MMETTYLFLSSRYACRKIPDIEAANHSFTSILIQCISRCMTLFRSWSRHAYTYATSLDLGDELAERLLVEFQDTSKVTHYYVNDLGGKYRMSKITPKEKEQGYGICANNDPSEQNFAIFIDALSHMGNASVYVAAAEAQSRGNNDWGLGVDSLVTGCKSKTVSVLPYTCFNTIN